MFILEKIGIKNWDINSAVADLNRKIKNQKWLEEYKKKILTTPAKRVLEDMYPGLGDELYELVLKSIKQKELEDGDNIPVPINDALLQK